MPQPNRDDALSWLTAVLWPDADADADAAGDRDLAVRPGHGGTRTWWASPSADDPRILIPADAPAAARLAVRRYHDGFDLRRRARSLVAEATMAVPGLAGLILRRAEVGQRPPAGTDVRPGVIDAVAERLGVPDLVVAIGLSVPKSNRKPVLQLLTPSGRCLGWAKVGWSPISERLVANEADWLERPTSGNLVTPELLLDEVLCGRRVVVSSALDTSRRPRRAPHALPPVEVFRSVAERGPVEVVALDDSPWWHSVVGACSSATETERRAIDAVAAEAAGFRFEVGAWHGDLTPWNLMTVGRRIQLIDWELAADGVPIGFDLCHFHTQVGAEMKGLDADAAIARSARLSPQGLAALGVEPANHSMLWSLYLVELVRRLIVLRAEGFPTEHLHHGSAALRRLLAMADRREAACEMVGGR